MIGRCCLLLGLGACHLVFELDDTPLQCPEGYEMGVLGRYKPVFDEDRWVTAESRCRADSQGTSTHLVVLSGPDELTEILGLAPNGRTWLGFTDRAVEGAFEWVSSENADITFAKDGMFPWNGDEPDDGGGVTAEDCAVVVEEGFNDISCARLETYICECDAHPSQEP